MAFKTNVNHDNLIKLSTYVTVAGVSVIIIAKIFGWLISDSVSMLASLVDSLLDIAISIMNLATVHYSLQPPDNEHRFGHGKAEDLAVFCQAIFFGSSGIFIIFSALHRMFVNSSFQLKANNTSILILLFSIAVTLIIILFQKFVIKRSKSNVIEADSIHYISDFLTNIAAIIGIYLSSFFHSSMFDVLMASIIAFYIIFNAIKMFKNAFNNLMDRELAEEQKQLIIHTIKSHPKILGFHDLKTRYAGTKPFVQLHIELDEKMILREAHKVVIEVEDMILQHFPNAEIIIHQDPDGAEEEVIYKD